jgi:hypothetical protein
MRKFALKCALILALAALGYLITCIHSTGTLWDRYENASHQWYIDKHDPHAIEQIKNANEEIDATTRP